MTCFSPAHSIKWQSAHHLFPFWSHLSLLHSHTNALSLSFFKTYFLSSFINNVSLFLDPKKKCLSFSKKNYIPLLFFFFTFCFSFCEIACFLDLKLFVLTSYINLFLFGCLITLKILFNLLIFALILF